VGTRWAASIDVALLGLATRASMPMRFSRSMHGTPNRHRWMEMLFRTVDD
jgi:hypothetical protein